MLCVWWSIGISYEMLYETFRCPRGNSTSDIFMCICEVSEGSGFRDETFGTSGRFNGSRRCSGVGKEIRGNIYCDDKYWLLHPHFNCIISKILFAWDIAIELYQDQIDMRCIIVSPQWRFAFQFILGNRIKYREKFSIEMFTIYAEYFKIQMKWLTWSGR